MECFVSSFPERLAQISRLRSTDTVFAEICGDYETLMGLLPRDADDPVYADIRESLSGLEDEIKKYLDDI